MNLSKLLSTREREDILNGILFREGEIRVADVSRSLNISKGFVSRFLTMLVKEKIVRKSKKKYVISENLNVKLLKILFNLKQFSSFSFKRYRFVKGAGIYGSCAKGENTESSDVDIWVKVELRDEEMLAKLTGALKRKSGKISPLYLTEEKLEILKKEDPAFYNSLAFGSITLYGENLV